MPRASSPLQASFPTPQPSARKGSHADHRRVHDRLLNLRRADPRRSGVVDNSHVGDCAVSDIQVFSDVRLISHYQQTCAGSLLAYNTAQPLQVWKRQVVDCGLLASAIAAACPTSRIPTGMHYASDILAGAVIGVVTVLLAERVIPIQTKVVPPGATSFSI